MDNSICNYMYESDVTYENLDINKLEEIEAKYWFVFIDLQVLDNILHTVYIRGSTLFALW